MIKKIVISLMALFIVAMVALSFYGNTKAADPVPVIDGQLKILMFQYLV